MIKVYAYPTTDERAKDLVLNDREYFEWVSADKAQWFYSPVDLGLVWHGNWSRERDTGGDAVRQYVRGLQHYQGNKQRHFFHDYAACPDNWGLNSVLFRAVKSKHDPNPLTISIPHTVDDFKPQPVDFSTLPYDICFVGRVDSCPVRSTACYTVRDDKSIRSFMKLYTDFFGYIKEGTKKWNDRRMEFINGFRVSKMALSPKGVELDAYRTWEAMSAGRVPIWIGDDYELPFTEFVDYGKFMFQYPESDAHRMNECVKSILSTHTDAQLQAHGEAGRRYWLEYYTRQAVPKVFAYYLEKL